MFRQPMPETIAIKYRIAAGKTTKPDSNETGYFLGYSCWEISALFL